MTLHPSDFDLVAVCLLYAAPIVVGLENFPWILPPAIFRAHTIRRWSRGGGIMETKSQRRRRSCWQAARSRAERRRRPGSGRMLLFAWVVLELLSPPSHGFGRFLVPANTEPPRAPNEYERGESFRPRSTQSKARYASRPSLRRLMRDLRRPAARADARKALLGMLSDPATRAWVVDRLDDEEINRVSVFVRSGVPDEAVFAAWAAEARVPEEDDDEGEPTPPKPSP